METDKPITKDGATDYATFNMGIAMNEINEYADEMIRVYGLKVYSALHDSKLRGDVLIFFKKNPFYMTTSHVSKSMHVDYSNIKRVIDGDGRHYAKDKGLYVLRLLDRKITEDGDVYSINLEGYNAAELLEKERETHIPGQLTVNDEVTEGKEDGGNRN